MMHYAGLGLRGTRARSWLTVVSYERQDGIQNALYDVNQMLMLLLCKSFSRSQIIRSLSRFVETRTAGNQY